MTLRCLCLSVLLLLAVMPVRADDALYSNVTSDAPKEAAQPADATATGAQTSAVDIQAYEIKGNTLLAADEIGKLLAPFTGRQKTYTDIQRALEMLEALYRSKGYGAVHVYLPEQDITEGHVVIQVTESTLGKVTVSGQNHHDEANILAALPALKPGEVPNARLISDNVQLSNQNPVKIVDVVLSVADEDDKVNAKVTVADDRPWKVFATLDNTGNPSTGRRRLGVGFQHANLFNRDHVATLNYTMSPDYYDRVGIYSASYRLPIYPWGDSIDAIAAYSDVTSGTSATVAGPLNFSGKGYTYSLHYNLNLARQGEYASKIVFGLDWRDYLNNCTLGTFGAAGCGAGGASVTLHPVSATYSGDWQSGTQRLQFGLTYSHNIPGRHNGRDEDFALARPAVTAGGQGADAGYQLIRGNIDYTRPLFSTPWIAHLAASGQYTNDALVSGEQFGLAGSSTVRGFQERELSRDRGYVLNAELYTPELGKYFGMSRGSLRALGFIDESQGWNKPLAGENSQHKAIASLGAGLRFGLEKYLSFQLDVARTLGTGSGTHSGDYRGHFNAVLTY